MSALLEVHLGVDQEYRDFVTDAVKLSTVYFVALLVHCAARAKPAKVVEQWAVEIYAALLLGLLAYHLCTNFLVRFV